MHVNQWSNARNNDIVDDHDNDVDVDDDGDVDGQYDDVIDDEDILILTGIIQVSSKKLVF